MTEANDWQPVGADDWQPVAKPEPKADTQLLSGTENAPIPQAFIDRMAQGQALSDAYSEKQTALQKLWGVNGPRYQLWPERMVRSGATLAGDVLHGDVTTGPGLRKQDFSDDPEAPEPLDELIARSGDMAAAQLAQSSFARIAPLLNIGDGSVARPLSDAAGTMHAQVVGSLPTPQDFKVAADNVGGPQAEARLQQLWKDQGIHPAEAAHDAKTDAFLKHDLTSPIVAYHGSPHDFTAFSMEKIGTGEGAQVYGHGLYFAESREVANKYKEAARLGTPQWDALTYAEHELATKMGQFDTATEAADFLGKNATADQQRNIMAAMEQPAHEYQVRIHADKQDFIDWHKPLDEQSPHVKDAVKRAMGIDYYGNFDPDKAKRIWDSSKYASAGTAIRNGLIASDDELVASRLGDAGIPGIKYLDSGSRATGSGTHNLVLFSDDMVEITHKNGQPFFDSRFHDAQDAKTAAIVNGQAEGEIPLRALGAEVTDPPRVPLSEQPAPPPGRLTAALKETGDKLLDIGRDAQMLVAPMARGTTDSMAMAKDFANTMRRNRWEWSRIDDDIAKRFTPEQRTRMWNAADEESVARQLGESTEHQGLTTLEPAERAAVDELQTRAQLAWGRARDLGMVEGEGLPAYTPRMVLNAASAGGKEGALPLNSIGSNLKTRTSQLLHRQYLTAEETEAAAKAKYGKEAEIARDIRVLPLATARLEDAVAGRTLINNIKDYGKSTGAETVSEGAIPVGSDQKWFTLDHPAFKTWRPKFEDGKAVKDAEGNTIFEQVPLYVHGDFEGPLRAVLTERSGPLYSAAMALKGKTMSMIMNSPLIHNAVEWGRALPAMPGKVATFKVYFEGNRFKNDVAGMREAIDNGLVPIGHRFFKQDISSIMEAPDLTPGRSWTAKILSAVPGLFDEGAGTAVKRAVDKAGDFWHNTLLWDRVGDLQAGLYTNFRTDLMAKGVDQTTASRVAAHFANRFAGSLPQEAMSNNARKVANMLLFSRTFTMGNLGVLKDMFTGLPKDVLAQIERDAGFKAGSIEGAGELEAGAKEAVSYAKTMARRKAMAVVATDIALFYAGNSVLQSSLNVMLNDSTLDREMHGYVQRLQDMMTRTREHPLSLLQPFNFFQGMSATGDNEPGRQDRVAIGYAKDGTAIYARNPVGKIGEEFIGYMTGPLDMMRRKLGTIVRPAWQIMSNDKGFGRKIYDPDADTPAKYLQNVGAIAAHIMKSQFPEGQFNAFSDLIKGEGDAKVNALQAFGPIAGVTFSKGAPGGPAVGEMYHSRSQHDYAVQSELPDIRKQILRGDVGGARQRMTELGVPGGLQNFYVRTTINPATRLSGRSIRDFYLHATPEQRQRMERMRSTSPLAPAQ